MPVKYWDYPGGDKDFAHFRRKYIRNILQDTAAFGGCEMLRRIMSVVSVWDLSSIKNQEDRAVCESPAIRIGSRWVLENKHYNCIGDMLSVVRGEAHL